MSVQILQVLLVSLDHLLDHLAADGTGFPGGQVAVVALLQVDANFPWCSFSILNVFLSRNLMGSIQLCYAEFVASSKVFGSFKMETPTGKSRLGSLFISPMNL